MDLLLMLLGIIWGVYILTLLTGKRLLLLGIYPRKIWGLPGVIFSPFLHIDFNHLFFNSIPFFCLSAFVLVDGLDVYINVTIYISLMSGLLIWLFGRSALHIGASSLITGYWSFLMLNAYIQGGALTIFLAIICAYYFAGIFLGIFPSEKGVSWEGHLFGLIAGVLVNYGLTQSILPFFILT